MLSASACFFAHDSPIASPTTIASDSLRSTCSKFVSPSASKSTRSSAERIPFVRAFSYKEV
jgi:hypothetical protein